MNQKIVRQPEQIKLAEAARLSETEEASLGLGHEDKIHYDRKPMTIKAQEDYWKSMKAADDKSREESKKNGGRKPHKRIFKEKESAVIDDMEKGLIGEIVKTQPGYSKLKAEIEKKSSLAEKHKDKESSLIQLPEKSHKRHHHSKKKKISSSTKRNLN